MTCCAARRAAGCWPRSRSSLAQSPAPAAGRAAVDDGGAVDMPAELSLETALKIGRALQPTLRQARARTEAAEARVDIARAPLLPQVNATLNYTRATATSRRAWRHVAGDERHARAVVRHLQLLPQQHHRDRSCIWDFGQTWQRRVAAQGERGRPGGRRAGRRCCRRTCRSGRRSTRRARRATRSPWRSETLANQTKHVEQIRAFIEVGTGRRSICCRR